PGCGAPQRVPGRDRRRRPLRSLGRAQHPARLQPGLQGRGQLGPVLRGLQPAGRAARALPGLARLHAAERALRAQLHAGRQGQFLRMNAMQNITNRRAGWRVLAASTLALALAACGAGQGSADAAGTGTAAQAEDAEDRADRAREAARSDGVTAAAAVPEAFATPMTPGDNIDSVASWTGPDGKVLLLATAKSTHRLVVYDGATGALVRHVGERGAGPGQFDRPNGIAVADDLAFVVERDNHRVQVLRLPGMETVAEFGADVLQLPYGLWVNQVDGGYEVYVTDAYMAGEDAEGEDILPPLAELDRRVHRFALAAAADGSGYRASHIAAFGDTTPEGALRVVESLWGDAANDR